MGGASSQQFFEKGMQQSSGAAAHHLAADLQLLNSHECFEGNDDSIVSNILSPRYSFTHAHEPNMKRGKSREMNTTAMLTPPMLSPTSPQPHQFFPSCYDFETMRNVIDTQTKITFSITDTTFSPLFIACHNGLLTMVHRLIEQGHTDFSSPDSHGCTPLYIACYKGHYEIAQTLLEQQVDVNVGKPPFSPLYAAARNGHLEIVQLLLTHKANLYLSDNDQYMAYDVAATKEIRSALLTAHEHDGHGLCALCWETPVHIAFAFVPCGHKVVCRACNDKMHEKKVTKCPICRAEIWSRPEII